MTSYRLKKQFLKEINLKKSSKIKLGNLEVSRDWGWATEYVNIMKKIINLSAADDFIICTGRNYKLRKVVNLIFSHYNLNYKKYVYQSKNLLRSKEDEANEESAQRAFYLAKEAQQANDIHNNVKKHFNLLKYKYNYITDLR